VDTRKVVIILLLGGFLMAARSAARSRPTGYFATFFHKLDSSTLLTVLFCLFCAALIIALLFTWKYWMHKVSEKRIAEAIAREANNGPDMGGRS
jgi:uncharacterized membrane protein YciS (DUF1049 family)